MKEIVFGKLNFSIVDSYKVMKKRIDNETEICLFNEFAAKAVVYKSFWGTEIEFAIDNQDISTLAKVDDILTQEYGTPDYIAEGALRVWKEKKIGDRVREYCKENGGYVFFMEQTAFNAALQGEILILHPRYNAYTMMYCMTYEELMNLRSVKRFYSKHEIDEAVANPAIMHLTNSFLITNRAWYENTNHPQKELYNSYKALTPWKDEPNFKDTRNMKQKIVQTMVDVLPRNLVITIANNLYNNRRVKMIKETIIDARKKTGLEMED